MSDQYLDPSITDSEVLARLIESSEIRDLGSYMDCTQVDKAEASSAASQPTLPTPPLPPAPDSGSDPSAFLPIPDLFSDPKGFDYTQNFLNLTQESYEIPSMDSTDLPALDLASITDQSLECPSPGYTPESSLMEAEPLKRLNKPSKTKSSSSSNPVDVVINKVVRPRLTGLTLEEKKARRLARNRLSAQKTRAKKKEFWTTLQDENNALRSLVSDLQDRLATSQESIKALLKIVNKDSVSHTPDVEAQPTQSQSQDGSFFEGSLTQTSSGKPDESSLKTLVRSSTRLAKSVPIPKALSSPSSVPVGASVVLMVLFAFGLLLSSPSSSPPASLGLGPAPSTGRVLNSASYDPPTSVHGRIRDGVYYPLSSNDLGQLDPIDPWLSLQLPLNQILVDGDLVATPGAVELLVRVDSVQVNA